MDRRRGGAGAHLSTSPALTAASEARLVREAARRRRARRGAAIAALSSVVVLGGLALLIVTSPGWSDVQSTFFDWAVFRESFPEVLRGFWLDVKIFLVVEVVVLALALPVALCRNSRAPAFFPLRMLAVVFTDVMRGVPVLLVVYLIGFGVPALGLSGLPTDPVVLGGIALALCYTAYVAEVYRAGLDSIHPGRRSAAVALGLTEGQAMTYVVAPRRCAAWSRRCSTTSSRCRRTSRWCRCSARRRPSAWPRSARRRTSTTRRSWRRRSSTWP